MAVRQDDRGRDVFRIALPLGFDARLVRARERFLTEGKLDSRKMIPFTLTMPDNNYWGMGNNVGKAWSIGKNLKTGK